MADAIIARWSPPAAPVTEPDALEVVAWRWRAHDQWHLLPAPIVHNDAIPREPLVTLSSARAAIAAALAHPAPVERTEEDEREVQWGVTCNGDRSEHHLQGNGVVRSRAEALEMLRIANLHCHKRGSHALVQRTVTTSAWTPAAPAEER